MHSPAKCSYSSPHFYIHKLNSLKLDGCPQKPRHPFSGFQSASFSHFLSCQPLLRGQSWPSGFVSPSPTVGHKEAHLVPQRKKSQCPLSNNNPRARPARTHPHMHTHTGTHAHTAGGGPGRAGEAKSPALLNEPAVLWLSPGCGSRSQPAKLGRHLLLNILPLPSSGGKLWLSQGARFYLFIFFPVFSSPLVQHMALIYDYFSRSTEIRG